MDCKPLKSVFRAALPVVVCVFSSVFAQVTIVVNNVGYEKSGAKRAVVQSPASITATTFDIVNASGAAVLTSVPLKASATVGSWSGNGFRNFKVADFSSFDTEGSGYRVRVGADTSQPFSIGEKILQTKTGTEQVAFFKAMRNTDESDRNLPIFGSTQKHNIYGGWWDATGDPGKHISHLSYANYFSPQQIPLVVWALLHANELQPAPFGAAAREEAAWGADYLLRALSAEGYFYMSVFDNWGDGYRWVEAERHGSGTRGEREICAWGDLAGIADGNSDGIRSGAYQCAMREGGGVSIAALARAYKAGVSGDSGAAKYLAGAVRAYAHLKANPTKYQDDGKENIIDDYCGLLAAAELYSATGEPQYSADAAARAASLLSRQSPDGWFYSGTDAGGQNIRPFYHAADEGMPVVALSRYYEVGDPVSRSAVIEAIGKNLRWYYKITNDPQYGANPFEYVKMYRAAGASGGGVAGSDLARGRPATASREEGAYTAASAFDGSSTTRWSSYQNGAQNDSQWIRVELDDVYKVNKVILNWETASGKHYRIDVSTNGTSWSKAFETTNNDGAGRKEHTFTAADAKYVRMFGVTRNLEYGGFSLFDFEVYGEEANVPPPSPYQASFFIPKANETGYWWQGENARLASLASAFIIGAPYANPGAGGELWRDSLFAMATAQLDWILGKNPFNVCLMYGYGANNYPDYPATRPLKNIKGGICNGISSAEGNENNIAWMPHKDDGDDFFWKNWRYIEQWLPHNAWYTVAVSSLSHRIEFGLPQVIAVRHVTANQKSRLRISTGRGRVVRVGLPFGADSRTDAVIYNMRGQKIYSYNIKEGSRAASIKIPVNIARGAYVLSVKDGTGKNKVTGRIYLK